MQIATAQERAERPRLVLVDGSGYIFRAYHALPPLTRPDGTPVGAVYGYTSMLLKTLDDLHATHVAVIFDAARITFRNQIYAAYKANRPETPEDLIPQFALIREATAALNVPAIELADYEADDLIASYARAATAAGMEVLIVSSDKDLMQLIDGNVQLYDPIRQRIIGAEQVMEKFGVTPDRVIEVQALIGDSVDNVPGIPGIGPKTAAELIGQFGSLEETLRRAGEVKQNKRRESLIEYAEQARISYELVKLKADVPLPSPIEALTVKSPDIAVLSAFLTAQNFKALQKKLETRFGTSPASASLAAPQAFPAMIRAPKEQPPIEARYISITDAQTLKEWIERARKQGVVAVDTETTSLDAMQATLVGVSLALSAGEACYIPLNHVESVTTQAKAQASLFGEESSEETLTWQRVAGQMSEADALALLKPLLEDDAVLKIGQNIKYDALVLAQHGVMLSTIDDTMLLSYVTAAGLHPHNMDELAERHLQHRTIRFDEVVGTGRKRVTFDKVPLDAACAYAAEDADITLRLHTVLKAQLMQDKLVSVYETLERALVPVIVAMERTGICVDTAMLEGLSKEFAAEMVSLEAEIYLLAGHAFNIASPKQLGEILFEEMQLPGGKKSSKTGAYGTDADVLEELALQGHALPEKVLSWRGLSKLKSTYTDALVKDINPNTGRIHTSFSMAATTTGRLSSSDPNLQNIPIRSAHGRRIRAAFVAAEGCKLISADYSQIELRLLAHIADIGVLKQAFKDGADIHAATASQMFGVPQSEVDGELRRRAKTINFGIIYGISAHGLAARLGISRTEAGDYIERYFAQYPGIRDYMERTKVLAREQGYVTTLFGRRVHVKDIRASNPNLRAFSERAAINAPLQGTAADIIKRAMVDVYDTLAKDYPQARLLLQVHDELIVECPEAMASDVAARVKKIMSRAAHLSVPLLVEAGIGDNWGAIH